MSANTETRYQPSEQIVKHWQTLKKEHAPTVYGTHDFLQDRNVEIEGRLTDYIRYFDMGWLSEGLPQDWYNLTKKIGFSMDSQMSLLQSLDPSDVNLWGKRTEQDLRGFCLEYLSDGLVYPFRYTNQGGKLVDKQYKKEMLQMVSEKERNGAVVQSLSRIEDFFLDPHTPDNSIAVMPSPMGNSNLYTDNGDQIEYPDSYWFVMVKQQEQVKGFTIKTDFNLRECREAIKFLSGRTLPIDAPLEEYVTSITLQKGDEQNSVHKVKMQVVQCLKEARESVSGWPAFSYQQRTWDEVLRDISFEDELYDFNDEREKVLEEFTSFVLSHPDSKLTLQKALAATILRLSREFLFNKKANTAEKDEDMDKRFSYWSNQQVSYGQILDRVASIPGCAGGGSSVMVFSIIPLLATVSSEQKKNICNHCQESSVDNHYHCTQCNKKYADETNKKSSERTKKCSCGFKFNC